MIPTPAFIVRLREADRESVRAHFIALGPDDRRLRFGGPLADEAISGYVDRIDFAADAVFAVHDDNLRPVALIHVALSGEAAELGLSALPGWRGHGLGNALMARAVKWLRNRGIHQVFVRCLAANAGMMHLARKSGMRLARSGSETDGRLELDAATADSFVAEWLEDQRGEAMRAFRANALFPRPLFAAPAS